MNDRDAGIGQWALLAVLALFSGVLPLLALLDASFVLNSGVFEYPLDDPYIHLAMANQMAAGGYGVNAGEYASAASSILYPVLLMPFAGDALQRFLPLVWNGIGLVAATLLWGRIIWQAGLGTSVVGIVLAVAGPIALNMTGVSFLGMEHALHVAASLAIVSGLVSFLDHRRVGRLLYFGVLLAPLLRFEGLALALLTVLLVLAFGRLRVGLTLLALVLVPLGLFAWGLTLLGLDPVPSSVLAKLSASAGATGNAVEHLLANLSRVISETRAAVLAIFIALTALLLMLKPVRRSGRWPLLIVIGGAGAVHLLLGGFAWMDRYEIYILCTMAGGLLAVAGAAGGAKMALLPVLAIGAAAAIYVPALIQTYSDAPRAVHLQQGQMARFARDFLREPVAVNDLGRVVWGNPDYVLDLWGLASPEARRLRLNDLHPGWVGELARARDVPVAMIYAHWFDDQIGDDWVLLGKLRAEAPTNYLGGHEVSFYLTGPRDAAPYVVKLRAWQAGLPKGARFDLAEGVAG